jgi:hypothetical protein
VTDAQILDEPTEEDVAAIAAVLFSEQPKTIQETVMPSQWVIAARREGVDKWEQPNGLSRMQDIRDRE